MNNRKNALLVASLVLLLVASVSVVRAGLSGWDLFWAEAGRVFGLEQSKKVNLSEPVSVPSEMPFAGAEGDTFSTSKKAVGIMSPDSKDTIASGTMMVSILNNSGVERIITSCFAYFEGTSTLAGQYAAIPGYNIVLDFSTSTTATASSSDPLLSFTFNSSSAQVVSFVSNTLHSANNGAQGKGWKRKWATSEYLNINASSPVSTTEAFAGCEYDLFN
ncbi:MAG: hypothetical protein AAB456_03385 [Patescibacteria group bacterium]